MSDQLSDLNKLLDSRQEEDAQEILTLGLQALLYHQVIYEDTPGLSKAAFRMLIESMGFVEKYFSAIGFDVSYDAQPQMISLHMREAEKGHYAWRQMMLKKDETMIRLVLRYLFEQGMTNGTMDKTGRVKTDTAAIIDTYERLSGGDKPPSERNLIENMLRDLSRAGAVRIGDRVKSEKLTEITILPGIRVHVSDRVIAELNTQADKMIKQEAADV